MNLKEERIKLGLTQKEAADYLNIPLRTYQDYETNEIRKSTYKYTILVTRLSEKNNPRLFKDKGYTPYKTNVFVGEELNLFVDSIKKYQARDMLVDIMNFLNDDEKHILILYGLRRTGKTTLMFQAINKLKTKKCAYITLSIKDTLSSLTSDLLLLQTNGYKYVFIDEVTLLEDFIDNAHILSDIYAMMGMKIVLSGTNSLGFLLASKSSLYDRCLLLHTSYISFSEHKRLIGIDSVNDYIEYGGLLMMENSHFGDKEIPFDSKKYLDSSIVDNILNSLRKYDFERHFESLQELEYGEIKNVINRVIEDMNHRFLVSIIEKRFKSSDLGSAKQLLIKKDESFLDIFDSIDEDSLMLTYKALASIIEKEEQKHKIERVHLEQIKEYLQELDLIYLSKRIYEGGLEQEYVIFTQPAIRYSLAKILIYSLNKDDYFKNLPKTTRDIIMQKIIEDVKGRMLEDIILLETNMRKKEAFKYCFKNGLEYDMVVIENDGISLYEIKHSDKVVFESQTKVLVNDECMNSITKMFGKIKERVVLYNGPSKIVENIKYLNIDEYLLNK